METINFFLLKSLQSEFKLISGRVKFLSKQYKNVYNMNNDILLKTIFKYKKIQSELANEILRYRFIDGCENFNFAIFETYTKKDTTTNFQMYHYDFNTYLFSSFNSVFSSY